MSWRCLVLLGALVLTACSTSPSTRSVSPATPASARSTAPAAGPTVAPTFRIESTPTPNSFVVTAQTPGAPTTRARSSSSTVTVPATPAAPGPRADWPVFDLDPARSGVNPNERAITATNVGRLVVLWTQHLPDVADSAPMYRDGRLYLTMRGGSTIALDATTGAQLWWQTTTGPKITNSSPAVDPSGQWVYAYGLDGFVHKYAAATGREVTDTGWPAPVTLLTQVEKESSALNLANGKLYVTTSGYLGDQGHYDGHLVVVDLGSGASAVFNSLCSNLTSLLTDQPGQPNYCPSVQSGVWARAGAVVDPTTGHVFIATGNGPWNGTTNWGDSVLELSADGHTLVDSYTPSNQAELDDRDIDLGSTAPALLPAQPASKTPLVAVQGGKDGELRLLNRRDLSGQGHVGQLGGELQIVDAPGKCDVFTAPAVWTATDHSTWLFVATGCGLAGFQVVTSAAGETSLVPRWQQRTGGTSPVVVNGILFVAHSGGVDARAAATGRLLWTSPPSGQRGAIGQIHWESPIVVAGKLFIADENGDFTAFGLPGGSS